ncbi:hypothetical protein V7266_17655 [Neobacillus drentensis]|uniref:hypothetical protein n=1 Tax=Neobacillus drentensis TaxID=220684 RepID=UPI002FFD5BAC
MLSLVWAFGATLTLLLILSLLRIGFSFKGKLIVALTGFVLALAGLAAVSSFPLWQTGLILVLLVLAAAYVMDSRFAALIFEQGTDLFKLETEEEMEEDILQLKKEKQADLELLDLNTDGDELAPLMTLEDIQEPSLQELSQANLETEAFLQESDELLQENDFLIDENPIPDDENTEIVGEKYPEEGYLADIESLLLEESDVIDHSEDEGWLEEINDIEILTDEEDILEEIKDENLLEELFLAAEEAAAGTEELKKDRDMEREVKLQK